MRQMWRGRRSVLLLDETLDDLTSAASGCATRRGGLRLLVAAVAGGVVGSETLSACTGPRPTSSGTVQAAVRGSVSGPGVTDFSGCVVILYEIAGPGLKNPSAQTQPVSPDGHYLIAGVPPGRWRVTCLPNGGTPLAAMTYRLKPGYQYSAGTVITITKPETVEADFTLQPAGALQVIVSDQHGVPVSGAYVWNFEAASEIATGIPTITDSSGAVRLANVPLSSKVFVIDPRSGAAVWWDGAQSWKAAKVVTLPGQREGISISATLP